MTKLIDYARELKREFEAQDTDGQAHPRFWVIRDYKKEVAADGYHDTVGLYDKYSCETITEEEYREEIKERIEGGEFCEDEIKHLLDEIGCGSIEGLIKAADDENRFHRIYFVETPYLVPNTFFLTKQDAKDYLKKYGYNHSPKAHTYAMTAIRSPKFEKLINLIMEVE